MYKSHFSKVITWFTLSLFFTVTSLNAKPGLPNHESKYGVGFRIITVYESSRNFRTDNQFEPRPIIIFLWYPAKSGSIDNKMKFRDFVLNPALSVYGPDAVEKEERDFNMVVSNYAFRGEHNATSLFQEAMNTETNTTLNAKQADGSFPLIVFGNGMNASGYLYYKQCELLAKKGYASAVIVSRYNFRNIPPTFDHTGINAQVNDIKFAVSYISGLKFVDPHRIGLAAWSVGGVSIAAVQNEIPDVKAFLSLDSGTSYLYGESLLKSFSDKKLTCSVPYFELRSGISSNVPRSRYYFDSLAIGKHCMKTVTGLDHFHFTSVANLLLELSTSITDKLNSFRFIEKFIVDYFDYYLNGIKNDSVLTNCVN